MPKKKYKYSKGSLEKLGRAHPYLIEIMIRVIKLIDCTIIETHRDKETQDKYFVEGKSRVIFPNSKHNNFPSLAVDVAPYIKGKVSWKKEHCIYLAGVIMAIASKYFNEIDDKAELRFGGNWNMDDEVITDQKFQDLVHYELIIYEDEK